MTYDRVWRVDLAPVRVSGALDRRIRLARQHLLAERRRILGGEGFGQAWGADQYGRWIGAVAQAAAYTRERLAALDETVREFVSGQAPNGFFSRTFNSLTWWGAGRAMIGLLEDWETTGDPHALSSATRLGDFYLSNFPLEEPGLAVHHGGHEEGLVALWRATGKPDYLRLAEQIPATVEPDFGKPGQAAPNHHTHSYLSTLRGCVDLYLATGNNKDHLRRAQDAWAHILRHQMWVSGGISEGSNYPFETRDETCSVADWLRLSLKLWQATNDAKYLDVAEHVLMNHLYFDQDHTGGFCAFRSIGEDQPGAVRDVVAWFCCSMHGLRALLEAVKFIYAGGEDRLAVNLFIPSEAEITLKGRRVRLKQEPAAPSRSSLVVELPSGGGLPFTLQLRIPGWTRSLRLAVNGHSPEIEAADGYALIHRTWQGGDRLEMDFDPVFRVVPQGINGFSVSEAQHATRELGGMEQAALQYGPWVLMLDPSLNIYDMFEWGQAEVIVPQSGPGEPFLPKIPSPILGRGELAVPEAAFMTLARPRDGRINVAVTDDSWKLAFLVPISEVTDRWTYTLSRTVPYEVRNDLRLLEPAELDGFLSRVQASFSIFALQRKDDTAVQAV